MTRRYYIFITLLVLSSLLLLFGCNNPPGASTNVWANFWPSNIGNSWTYSTELSYESNHFIASEIRTIESETTVGTIDVKLIRITRSSTTAVTESLERFDETGVYLYSTSAGPTTEPFILLSYPLFVGKTWECSVAGWTAEVTSIETVYAPPLGTFDAYRVVYDPADMIRWFANGIGEVKGYISGEMVVSIEVVDLIPIATTATIEYTKTITGKNF